MNPIETLTTYIDSLTNDIPPFLLFFFIGLIPIAAALGLIITITISILRGTVQGIEVTVFIALLTLTAVLFALSHKTNPHHGIQL